MSDRILSALQAAHHLGITPELLTAYARPNFAPGRATSRPLRSLESTGPIHFAESELDAFDGILQQPWSKSAKDRPSIPAAIVAHLKAESRNQCAWCGSGSRIETAHIGSWAATLSHYHHNLIRLCSVCHGRHDTEGTITTAQLKARKSEMVEATRANLRARMDGTLTHTRIPRPTARFYGRENDVDKLVQSLVAGSSILISGPGGIGKTELVLQALHKLGSDRKAIWVDVERYASSSAVLDALRNALSADGEPCGIEDIAHRLDQCEAILILDGIDRGNLDDLENFEDRFSKLYAETRKAQFVITSQVNLLRAPVDVRHVAGALGRADSHKLLASGFDEDIFEDGPELEELLELCEGHALTLQLAGAITSHYGSMRHCIDLVNERGSQAIALPARQRHDRTSSLNICLDVTFHALSPEAQAMLWVIAQAPAGLFRAQLERGNFEIREPVEALAQLRRWNLIYTTDPGIRERIHCLSPIRLFVADRWPTANREWADKLKRSLLLDIAMMVSVIEDRSLEAEEVGYMVARYSEEMPNIDYLINEAFKKEANDEVALLAEAVCSSLVRYFFVQRMAEEGGHAMLKAARIALANKRPDRAASFAGMLIGLARQSGAHIAGVAEEVIAKVEACRPLSDGTEGDLLIAKTMLALDAGEPERASNLSREAFERFKAASRKLDEPLPGDRDELDEQAEKERREGIHNDLASALQLHGDAQLAMRKYKEAADAYRHALRHQRGASVAVNLGQTLHQIGNCEGNLGNHAQATEYYAKALTVFLAVEMKEFTSNASGELGFALIDADLPSVRIGKPEGLQACFEDLEWEIRRCLQDSSVDLNRAFVVARKAFGTIALGIFARQARLTGDWALQTATDLLVPFADAAASFDERFTCTVLNIPLQLAFLVGELEASRDSTGDPEIGLVHELLRFCCSPDPRSRDMFRLADWLATYLTREMGVEGLTGARVREFMVNADDGVHDELELFRPRPEKSTE
ncbi:NB-ARC domain-containing protein [Stakelama marina]|uniref:AAA+ ATPase domain-containing protein n=1 Tax=Stakelama marina TaxID=2826939 RepID=A0A8T4IMH1_9SPHN|nr:tetratricopeptide repeat protein [Stakelama marina]MBR0553519.1 hypothetical protein [Stakelama marina]